MADTIFGIPLNVFLLLLMLLFVLGMVFFILNTQVNLPAVKVVS